MKLRAMGWVLAGVIAAGVMVFQTMGRAQGKSSDPGTCAQWEVTLAAVQIHMTVTRPPEAGKSIVEKAPPGGWEPFAYSPSGQLAYRRCAQ